MYILNVMIWILIKIYIRLLVIIFVEGRTAQ